MFFFNTLQLYAQALASTSVWIPATSTNRQQKRADGMVLDTDQVVRITVSNSCIFH